MREYSISRKQNETAEQREARLTKKRETVRTSGKRASQKQGERKGKCSLHQIEEGTPDPVSGYFPNETLMNWPLLESFISLYLHDLCVVSPGTGEESQDGGQYTKVNVRNDK